VSRLFTFGCSFTHYAWPTWADLFGLEFDHFENWGIAGIGNVAIANRVAECFVKNNITEDDTVIIQWSSHLRNDYHLFREPPTGRDTLYNWKTKGSIFNDLNNNIYDKKWLSNFFDEDSYIMYSLNAIYTTLELVKSKNCNWRMTSIGEFDKLGQDYFLNPTNYGETINSQQTSLWDNTLFLPYRKIWDNDNWITPLGTYCWNSDPSELYSWNNVVDPHPTPSLGIDWLYNVLKPSLGLDNNSLTDAQKIWIIQCKTIKNNVSELQSFGNILNLELENFNRGYKGY
jgi:hypothetical protein